MFTSKRLCNRFWEPLFYDIKWFLIVNHLYFNLSIFLIIYIVLTIIIICHLALNWRLFVIIKYSYGSFTIRCVLIFWCITIKTSTWCLILWLRFLLAGSSFDTWRKRPIMFFFFFHHHKNTEFNFWQKKFVKS